MPLEKGGTFGLCASMPDVGGCAMTVLSPILMRSDETLCIKQAMDYAGKSDKTIRRWIKGYRIGRQSIDGGPYDVSVLALEMAMHGDFTALEILRAGHRSAPEVRRYLDFLGLPE